MNFFVCLLNPEANGISERERRAYESFPRSRGHAFEWRRVGQVALLTVVDTHDGESLVASEGTWVAIGMVRLDNRADLQQWSGCRGQNVSDLELVLHLVARHGPRYIPKILGDFAFVVWNTAEGTGVAACDVFAVKKLYYTSRNGLFAFASRAEALAVEDRYEVQYLAELVANCTPSRELTVYAGVHPIPAGTMAVIGLGRLATNVYWSPDDFHPDRTWATSEGQAVEVCRDLLVESVRLRLSGNKNTWAQLSGGMDSSSIASIAQWLVERGSVSHGLVGTVTYVDRQGTGSDERRYSDAVISKWQLRNEMIIDPLFWYDESCALPRTDQPSFTLPFYPRERRLCAIVQAAGGNVLLTGIGGDELFTGIMLFFADWLAHGRVGPAVREMVRRAAMGRVSFWELAYRNSLLPLLPQAVQLRLGRDETQLPRWVSSTMARRYGLRGRAFVAASFGGRIGHKYHHAIVTNVIGISSITEYGIISDCLDVRHPFLYRPLVEFALQLPPELCTRPYERKWVVREAMRGILPDVVRTRVGKGTPLALYVHSLTAQRQLLEPLVQDPILAELGIVDAVELRAAFHAVPHQPRRKEGTHAAVHRTLMIEAWLQMRSGRWPHGDRRSLL
jgi:asparagine synthase (glutamine-hydrolysing)